VLEEEGKTCLIDKSKMKSKKAQVNSLAPAVLALVFAAIILVFGIIMAQSLRDIDTIGGQSKSIANESFLVVTDKAVNTSIAASKCGFGNDWAVTNVYNVTALGGKIPSSNYTVTATGTIIYSGTIDTHHKWNDTTWLVDSTYTDGGEACEAANATVVGLGTFANFWEIIVLAIIISIAVGLLLLLFGGASGKRR